MNPRSTRDWIELAWAYGQHVYWICVGLFAWLAGERFVEGDLPRAAFAAACVVASVSFWFFLTELERGTRPPRE